MRGARSKADVDPGFIRLLEAGTSESRTHVEQMSMRMSRLLQRTFPEVVFDPDTLDAIPFIARLRAVGALLNRTYGSSLQEQPTEFASDTVRGWIAMAIASDEKLHMDTLLLALLPFATDHHFAVREWAWLAARPRVAHEPLESLAVLSPIFESGDALERRFAVELTRPRSVWGEHIPYLKRQPETAERFLDLLMCDPSPYVRASVGNWLRDAGRSRPDWVTATTLRWLGECSCPATSSIVRRAERNLMAPSLTN